jgi:tetratricopeptide (TPR) repeat protein
VLFRSAIDSSTGISGKIDTAEVKLFLDGLIKSDQPSKRDREKAYMAWLEARHSKKINNLNIDSELANKYLTGTKDYAKAAQLFEMMIKKDPSKTENYMNLGICYAGLGKYNDAITMYEKAIIVQPQSEWAFRSHIAELYFNKGDKQKAAEELNKSILLLKKSPMPDKDVAIKSLESRLQDMKKAVSHG